MPEFPGRPITNGGNAPPTVEEKRNEALMVLIREVQTWVRGIYGYRRMAQHLNRELGYPVNRKRLYRLMKIYDLQAVIRRKKKRSPAASPQHVEANKLNRNFQASRPNEKWLTDVTEFVDATGRKAFLSAVFDLYDKSIIHYEISPFNNNPLVFQTMEQALRACPGAQPMIHSDRGFQYTSRGFQAIVETHGLNHSMSRVSRCLDNGPMEGFFGTLKCEEYYLPDSFYGTYEDLVKAIRRYIRFYNHQRYQEHLSGLTPIEYRNQAA